MKITEREFKKASNLNARSYNYKDDFSYDGDNEKINLVDDAKQTEAIETILTKQYSCIIGKAGTGKTHVVLEACKKLLEIEKGSVLYEGKELKPFVFLAFTNKAKNNLANRLQEIDCKENVLTIHDVLKYKEKKVVKTLKRDGTAEKVSKLFTPTYGHFTYMEAQDDQDYIENVYVNKKLPFKYVFVDEAGVVSVDLMNALVSALKEDTKLILLGDMAQLPPVAGVSPLPLATLTYPTVELETIHRNKNGSDIPLVASDVSAGEIPIFKNFKSVKLTKALKDKMRYNKGEDYKYAMSLVSAIKKHTTIDKEEKDAKKFYNPITDCWIAGTNDLVDALNKHLRGVANPAKYNKNHQQINPLKIMAPLTTSFSVGDKVVMDENVHTKNKGQLGFITRIEPNENYKGWDVVDLAKEKEEERITNATTDDELLEDISSENLDLFALNEESKKLDVMLQDSIANNDNNADTIKQELDHVNKILQEESGKDLKYIVHITLENGDKLMLKKTSELLCIKLGYALTVYKTQGSEYRNVLYVQSGYIGAKRTQNNEAVYTSITRGKENVYIFSDDITFSNSLYTRALKGSTLKDKASIMLNNLTEMVMLPVNVDEVITPEIDETTLEIRNCLLYNSSYLESKTLSDIKANIGKRYQELNK